ncbi:MAG: hypothetical protein ACP5DZ_11125 [Bacteroidales bacterium]
MTIKRFLLTVFAFFLVLTTGCNRKLPCEKIPGDTHFYRASGVAFSQKRDLAEEKAINVAKRNLVKEIARDLHKKTGMSEQLLMDSLIKGIKIQELEVVCKHTDKHKGSFRCSLAIEMPVERFSKFGNR